MIQARLLIQNHALGSAKRQCLGCHCNLLSNMQEQKNEDKALTRELARPGTAQRLGSIFGPRSIRGSRGSHLQALGGPTSTPCHGSVELHGDLGEDCGGLAEPCGLQALQDEEEVRGGLLSNSGRSSVGYGGAHACSGCGLGSEEEASDTVKGCAKEDNTTGLQSHTPRGWRHA